MSNTPEAQAAMEREGVSRYSDLSREARNDVRDATRQRLQKENEEIERRQAEIDEHLQNPDLSRSQRSRLNQQRRDGCMERQGNQLAMEQDDNGNFPRYNGNVSGVRGDGSTSTSGTQADVF